MKHLFSIAITFVILLSFAGCGNDPAATIPATTAPTSVPETLSQPTEPEETVPEPLPQSTEPEEPTLHSGLRKDGSFSEGTLFLGDSLTYNFTGSYLPESGHLGDAKYAAQCGSPVTVFFSSATLNKYSEQTNGYSEEFEGMEFDEAAAAFGEKAEAIYMMWGTNVTPDATKYSYIEIVEFLLLNCPNATIHLQTVPYGNVNFIDINQRITDAYSHFQQAGETRVLLVDTHSAIGNCTVDGVHLGSTGNARWYQAIVDHASANNLSE